MKQIDIPLVAEAPVKIDDVGVLYMRVDFYLSHKLVHHLLGVQLRFSYDLECSQKMGLSVFDQIDLAELPISYLSDEFQVLDLCLFEQVQDLVNFVVFVQPPRSRQSGNGLLALYIDCHAFGFHITKALLYCGFAGRFVGFCWLGVAHFL